MFKQPLLILVLIFTFFGCQKTKKLSETERYFINKLTTEKSSDTFEEDSEHGYIKIGNFLNPTKKNAVVISFDTITTFTVYELKKDQWTQIYQQKKANFSRINGLEAYIEDYNFDGVKDIGIKNEVSNGTAILTFHLWLSDKNSFSYVPDFEEIGNPVLLNKIKTIQGFKACCVYNEITLGEYHWEKHKLIKTEELEISNYPSGIEATLKNIPKKTERKITLSGNDISKIIQKYSLEKWQLNDTVANTGLLRQFASLGLKNRSH
ncbi:XAC2610-related protein [Flavobacterium pedocola]